MRQRNRLTADEWAERLDACMRMVLADPATFPEATVWWARWRREWLTESGSRLREPVARAEVDEGEGLAGPSCAPARAGGKVAQFRLRLGSEKVVGGRLSAPGRLVGPSAGPPRAGGPDRAGCLAAGPKKWPKRSVRGATACESTTSSRSSLSPASDNLDAR